MGQYKLVSGYRNDESLKGSFNALAMKTFGLDFRGWYNRGYWDDNYIPYSFVDEGKIIANASVFKMSVIIQGIAYNGIQIGTVMTDVAYRNQGLSKQLMEQIMKEHENACDFMYLFANDTVLDFYPRFGFTRLNESEFFLEVEKSSIQRNEETEVERLTIENDLALLERYAKDRYVNSTVLDVKHSESLLMFYFTLVFPNSIFYLEELETVVLMAEESGTLHIYDIISLKAPDIEGLLASILEETTEKAVFHFTPDFAIEGMEATVTPNDADALFVLMKKPLLEGNFKFPLTSHC
ncbi:GNAT family N-acetyltransferase [Metaplanococcus flavidus]|uniref:GNAT family N-acetyltransferase n=1 Tax=Metaplanococcus flavidus TaxID=569883 RepID=A0ABW3LGY1_9BACL